VLYGKAGKGADFFIRSPEKNRFQIIAKEIE